MTIQDDCSKQFYANPAFADTAANVQFLPGVLARWAFLILSAPARAKARRGLLELSDRDLRDIGLTRYDARSAANRLKTKGLPLDRIRSDF